MSARDWFGVGARLIGLFYLIKGMGYLFDFVKLQFGLDQDYALGGIGSTQLPEHYLMWIARDWTIAAILLLGTNQLIKWTYGATTADEANSNLKNSKVTLTDPTSDGE